MTRIGIICALYFEASAFPRLQHAGAGSAGKPPARQPVKLNEQTLLIVSGMGRERAKQAAHRLIEEGVDRLISFGSAGALAPGLKPGDLVLAEVVHDTEKTRAVTASLPASVGERLSRHNVSVHAGMLAHSEEPVADTHTKLKLFEQTGAVAADMESAGILEVAEQEGLPVSILRVITDSAAMTLPAAVLRRIDDFGRPDIPGLGLDLLTSPGQIPALLRLWGASSRARRTMKLVARELLEGG